MLIAEILIDLASGWFWLGFCIGTFVIALARSL